MTSAAFPVEIAGGFSPGVLIQPPVAADPGEHCRRLSRIVRQAAWEMYTLFAGEPMVRRNRRHAMVHIRQISIYVCHVGLSMPAPDVAACFGRDATTVRASCLLVEERREEPGFDDFVGAIERLAKSISRILEEKIDDVRN